MNGRLGALHPSVPRIVTEHDGHSKLGECPPSKVGRNGVQLESPSSGAIMEVHMLVRAHYV